MLVSDYMTTHLVVLHPEHRLYHALEIMEMYDIRHVPVVEKNTQTLLGIVSDRDIKRQLNSSFDTEKEEMNDRLVMLNSLEELMGSQLYTVSPQAPLTEVLELFLKHKISAVPVVEGEDDTLVGILTTHDIMDLFLELLRKQDEE